MEEHADLLVIGKRGQAADFATMHLGSNLERVIRASIRPVLVASREFHPIAKMLIAYDGGASVERVLEFVRQNPLLKGLECHLLRAGRIDDKARWFLEEAAEKLRNSKIEVTTHAIPGDPERLIGELARELSVQLIVMGAYGHNRIRALLVGSTTTAVVRTCLLPVLLFR
jgi:nucleotide-binding universal stress UspA family protein